MVRKVGSGFASPEADASARILAAHLANDAVAIGQAEEEFNTARAARVRLVAGSGRGFTASQLSALLAQLTPKLSFRVHTAIACGKGEAGDVLVHHAAAGEASRIEIKAQFTATSFSAIQNADWVRDETDFLGELLRQDTEAYRRLPPRIANHLIASYEKEDGWDLGSLWAADVAGVKNRQARHAVGITNRGELDAFLARKYFLHITLEGVRVFRISEFPGVAAALNGNLRYELRPPQKRSNLVVWTRGDRGQLQKGHVHLTYYLGQGRRPLGGHHMSVGFFAGVTPLALVRPP